MSRIRLEDIVIIIGDLVWIVVAEKTFYCVPGITLGDFLTRRTAEKKPLVFQFFPRAKGVPAPPGSVPLSFSFCFLAFVFCPLSGLVFFHFNNILRTHVIFSPPLINMTMTYICIYNTSVVVFFPYTTITT